LVSPEDDQMQHILEELLFEESEWTTPTRDRWDWGLPAPYSLSLPKLKWSPSVKFLMVVLECLKTGKGLVSKSIIQRT
jgi:hypothetical protein